MQTNFNKMQDDSKTALNHRYSLNMSAGNLAHVVQGSSVQPPLEDHDSCEGAGLRSPNVHKLIKLQWVPNGGHGGK